MKLYHAQFTNNIGQKIDVGDKVIVVRSKGQVLTGIYIGFTQRWTRGSHRPYVLVDSKSTWVRLRDSNGAPIDIPGKIRVSSPSGKVYKLA